MRQAEYRWFDDKTGVHLTGAEAPIVNIGTNEVFVGQVSPTRVAKVHLRMSVPTRIRSFAVTNRNCKLVA